ncbi:MAG: hypothetical protein PHX05_04700 [Acidobacteriota bacterium]|nr:hypothetical protein [Acidobacteriota bacterium]
MKKMFLLLLITMAVLAGPSFLGAYDLTAHNWKVLPEVIWAPASGGGTWVTECQITAIGATPTEVNVYFYYDGGRRGPFVLTTLDQYHTYRTTNLLSAIDAVDTGTFTYSGRVGAVWFWTTDTTDRIHVTAKEINGNYGKSMPALYPDVGTTAAVGRPMMIPIAYNGAVNRTFCGFFNTSSTTSITATIYIIDNIFGSLGSFVKTFPAENFQSFNPFTEAGIDANVYTNTWIYVYPTAGPAATVARGLMCFGAVANNTTNDPTAVLAYPFILENTATSNDTNSISTDADPGK